MKSSRNPTAPQPKNRRRTSHALALGRPAGHHRGHQVGRRGAQQDHEPAHGRRTPLDVMCRRAVVPDRLAEAVSGEPSDGEPGPEQRADHRQRAAQQDRPHQQPLSAIRVVDPFEARGTRLGAHCGAEGRRVGQASRRGATASPRPTGPHPPTDRHVGSRGSARARVLVSAAARLETEKCWKSGCAHDPPHSQPIAAKARTTTSPDVIVPAGTADPGGPVERGEAARRRRGDRGAGQVGVLHGVEVDRSAEGVVGPRSAAL